MNKQTKQIILYSSIAATAVASITTVIILTVHHTKKKKLANREVELFDQDSNVVAEDAYVA